MVPSDFIKVEEFPLSPTGKIDRKKLPEPETTSSAETAAFVAPEGEYEQALATIWREFLSHDEVSATADFFDLGGDSLTAFRMLAKVRTTFDIKLPVSSFLTEPTVRQLASCIEEDRNTHKDPERRCGRNSQTWELLELSSGSSTQPVILTINQPILYRNLAENFTGKAVVANLHVPDRACLTVQRSMSFEEIAADAASLVKSTYRGRKVVIVGLCVNGLVALKIAEKLVSSDVEPPSVVMIDTWHLAKLGRLPPVSSYIKKWVQRSKRWGYHFKQYRSGQIGLSDLVQKNNLSNKILRKLNIAEPALEDEEFIVDLIYHLAERCRNHEFKLYQGDVMLFRSEKFASNNNFGWDSVSGIEQSNCILKGWHEDAVGGASVRTMAQIIESRFLTPSKPYHFAAAE